MNGPSDKYQEFGEATEVSMSLSIRKVENATVIDLEGNLILGESADALRDQVRDLLTGGTTRVAVNLAQVKYLDSSGLGALAAVHTSLQNAGALCNFFGAPKHILTILEMVHLDAALDLLPNETSALASFRDHRSKKFVA